MKSILKRKYENLKAGAKIQKTSIFLFFVLKLLRKLWNGFTTTFNFLIVFIFSPIILIVALPLLAYRNNKKKYVVFVGLEHIIRKTIDRALLFNKKGYQVYYYSLQSTGIQPDKDIKFYSYRPFSLINIFKFIIDLYSKRFCYVEFYLESSFVEIIVFELLCKLSNTLCIIIERGMMINLALKNVGALFEFILGCIYKLGDKIFYREPYMLEHFERLHINSNRLLFDYNKIPVSLNLPPSKFGCRAILFLNSFVSSRRLDVFIKAIPFIIESVPDTQFILVGARSEEEFCYAKNLLAGTGLMNDERIRIESFTKNASNYYQQASIFVFPSDFIFANFSLLEAMEYGLVPVVSNMRDADRIIKHGENGFLLPQDSKLFAEHIILLLKNEELRKRMAIKAKETIVLNFNDRDRIVPILDMINSRYGLQN
jgi:glycosyltransferase involved in cell wall biosynthesis